MKKYVLFWGLFYVFFRRCIENDNISTFFDDYYNN